jgi:hypothetical protein
MNVIFMRQFYQTGAPDLHKLSSEWTGGTAPLTLATVQAGILSTFHSIESTPMAEEFFRQLDEQDPTFASIAGLIQDFEDGLAEQSVVVASYHALVAAGAFGRFMRATLRKVRDDAEFTPSWITASECAIVANRQCTLSIRSVAPDTGAPVIYLASGHIIQTLMSAEPVTFDIYRSDRATAPLVWVGEKTLLPGESIDMAPPFAFRCRLNGRQAVFSRIMLASADHTAVYDANTLEYISMLSLDTSNTRWYFMAKLAGQLESAQATPLLEQLAGHANYNVRWTALQELFNHDQNKAIDILRRFKDDPDDHIREQASSELARIETILAEGSE